MLDDRSSVEVLENSNSDLRAMFEQILSDGSGPLGRPVSIASFVLEDLLIGDVDLAARKLTNIVLHVFNGVLVYWLLILLVSTGGYAHARWLALLGCAIWLSAPLFVSTVLYVVQRMAMLAATFMLLSLIAYLRFRSDYMRYGASPWRIGLLLTLLLLAVFSKETGIVVLPVIVLLELLWFDFNSNRSGRELVLRNAAILALLSGAIFVFAVVLLYPDAFLSHYSLRNWGLSERLLTQARILWDYVGQFYWPDVNRMGLYHDDIIVSRSLYQPVTTIYAVAGWSLLIFFLFSMMRWQLGRRIAFCIFFYLFGHSTESTILPLELYFEHRNYFPGIGLVLLLVLLLAEVDRRCPPLFRPLFAWSVIAVVMLLLKTSSQVQVWSSSQLLRLNQVVYHPGSFRANADMASMLAAAGDLEEAIVYSQLAHEVGQERPGDLFIRNLALSCMSSRLPISGWGAGLEVFNSRRPLSSVATLNAFVNMFQDERCGHLNILEIANSLARTYLSASASATASANIYSVLAEFENALQRFDKAYSYAAIFLKLVPGNTRGQLMQLHFTTALGKVAEADALKQQLLDKQEMGQLSFSEQETLAMYLE